MIEARGPISTISPDNITAMRCEMNRNASPISACRRIIRLTTRALTATSSAETASSATISFGPSARALAMATRWRATQVGIIDYMRLGAANFGGKARPFTSHARQMQASGIDQSDRVAHLATQAARRHTQHVHGQARLCRFLL